MKSGIEQLQALVNEKSVAEIAGKAQLSRGAIYYLLRNERSAGKKIKDNLFLAYDIPVESWGLSAEPVPPGEPALIRVPDAQDTPVLRIREGLQLKIGYCEDCILHGLLGCCTIMAFLCGVDCDEGYIIVRTGE